MPMPFSIQGKAFSWPIARITSSQGKNTSPSERVAVMSPFSMSYSSFSNIMPLSLPSSITKDFGA